MGEEETAQADSTFAHRGRFVIAGQVVREALDTVIRVVEGLLIMEVEYRPLTDEYVYGAISPEHFEPLTDGEPVPTYDMAFDETTAKTTWTRNPA